MTAMKHGYKGEAAPIGFTRPGRVEKDRPGPLVGLLSFRWVLLAFVLLLWFVYYPIVDNFLVSTKNQDIFTGETSFIGLDCHMWNDPPGKGFFRRLITRERCGHIAAHRKRA